MNKLYVILKASEKVSSQRFTDTVTSAVSNYFDKRRLYSAICSKGTDTYFIHLKNPDYHLHRM